VSSSESFAMVPDYTVKHLVTQFYNHRGAHLSDPPSSSDELFSDVSSSLLSMYHLLLTLSPPLRLIHLLSSLSGVAQVSCLENPHPPNMTTKEFVRTKRCPQTVVVLNQVISLTAGDHTCTPKIFFVAWLQTHEFAVLSNCLELDPFPDNNFPYFNVRK
jgi:hypothetical protein